MQNDHLSLFKNSNIPILLELHECMDRLVQLTHSKEDAFQLLHRNIMIHKFGHYEWNLQDVMEKPIFPSIRKELLTFYYRSANVGINKIEKALKISQQTIYKTLQNPHYALETITLDKFLEIEPQVVHNLDLLMEKLNAFDGLHLRKREDVELRDFAQTNH